MKKLEGKHGLAQTFDLPAIAQGRPDAGVEVWLVKAPWAHPWWHSYVIMLLHLRPMAGVDEPKMYVKGATNEIIIFALNNGIPVSLDKPWAKAMLHPCNFAAQFIATGDEAAALKVQECVQKIVDGELSPDTDHIQSWGAIFNRAMFMGDPATVGETRIIHKVGDRTTEVVHDPKPPGAKPNLNPPWHEA